MPRNHEYSQHFLRSPHHAAELLGHSNIRKNDVVYVLGAGSGVISSVLSGRVKKVIAVEIEPTTLHTLRNNLGHVDNVTIIDHDIMTLPIPTSPYKIFSNIPFNLSAAVIRKFTEADLPPRSMYLITQRQFARKLVPGNDHFTSQLSAEISPWFTVRIRKPLRRTDFTPPPAVDTVLLEIKIREEPLLPTRDKQHYRDFTARAFAEQKYFTSLTRPFSPELRPSQLTTDQWIALFDNNR